MSKLIDIGGYLVCLDSIIAIKPYETDDREWVGDRGRIWFPLCLFKKEYVDGYEVEHSLIGRFITKGKRKRMLVFTTSELEIDIAYDESIIERWKKHKDGSPTQGRSPSFIEDLGNGVEKHDLVYRVPADKEGQP